MQEQDGLVRKQGMYLLAFYLCMDLEDFSDYEYHPNHWTQRVFCVGENYYCPYKSRPTYRYGGAFKRENWVKVTDIPFPYTNNTIWIYQDDNE